MHLEFDLILILFKLNQLLSLHMHGGNGIRLAHIPPPPISFYGYTTDLLKAISYTILIHI